MNEKLVSIIVPIYNAEDYLETSVQTLLNQTYKNIEILLLDDGSSDESLAKCKKLAEKDSRCKVMSHKNHGVSFTRNLGISEARGEYIMFFDCDDFLEEHAVKLCVDRILQDNSDAVFFGMYFDTYRKGKLVSRKNKSTERNFVLKREAFSEMFVQLANNNYISPVWNKLIKKSVITEGNVQFNERLSNYEDYLFSLQLLERLENVSVIADTLYHYIRLERIGGARRFVQNLEEKQQILISEVCKAFERLKFDSEEFEKYKKANIISWLTLVMMNFCKEKNGMRAKVKNISAFIRDEEVYKILASGETKNKYASLLCHLSRHRWALAIYVVCTLKLKYKEKRY